MARKGGSRDQESVRKDEGKMSFGTSSGMVKRKTSFRRIVAA